jgi:cell division protein FtsI (penicillin-binding protein 3)
MAQEALGGRLVTVRVPALRGAILDAKGQPLASSAERFDVVVNQRVVKDWTRFVRSPDNPNRKVKVRLGVPEAAAMLAPALNMDLTTLTTKLTGDRGYAVIAKAVTPAVWRKVEAQKVGGVDGVRTSQRVHPSGGLAAPITGWYTPNADKFGGIEQRYNAQLTGVDGERTYERDPSGRQIATGEVASRDAVPGQDVRLTIDRDLQWKAEQAIAAQVTATNALSGTAIVIRVKDGAILAMANAPAFNPAAKGKALTANLGNRSVEDVYEPGSTGKVMTAAAALDEGVVTPMTPFVVNDTIRRGGKTFHDSHPHPTEYLTFAGVLAKSSNVGTIMTGERVSPEVMHSYFTKFGVGQPSGLGLPGESRGILAPVDQWSGSQRYTVLFGQGLSVNSIQAAGVYATLANGGVRMPPRLVQGIQRADGIVRPNPVAPGTRVVSEATAKKVIEMLEGAVSDEGTAPEARIPGYRVAGKTGTAQRYDDGCGCYRGYTGSFIGLAPADAPELVVAVTLQRPIKGYYGGTVAAPVFRDIMTYALHEMQIPPTGTTSPSIQLETDGG